MDRQYRLQVGNQNFESTTFDYIAGVLLALETNDYYHPESDLLRPYIITQVDGDIGKILQLTLPDNQLMIYYNGTLYSYQDPQFIQGLIDGSELFDRDFRDWLLAPPFYKSQDELHYVPIPGYTITNSLNTDQTPAHLQAQYNYIGQ